MCNVLRSFGLSLSSQELPNTIRRTFSRNPRLSNFHVEHFIPDNFIFPSFHILFFEGRKTEEIILEKLKMKSTNLPIEFFKCSNNIRELKIEGKYSNIIFPTFLNLRFGIMFCFFRSLQFLFLFYIFSLHIETLL